VQVYPEVNGVAVPHVACNEIVFLKNKIEAKTSSKL
jgi:hypothetical protein